MSHYLDPDKDHAFSGPSFRVPPELEGGNEIMHAAGIVLHRFGILLRGPSGSGKSLLQRKLRQGARARGAFSALISDDYVRLARPEPPAGADGAPLVAFAPVATHQLQEVRGIGVVELEPQQVVSRAVIHLLVDLVAPEQIERMPERRAPSRYALVRLFHICRFPNGPSTWPVIWFLRFFPHGSAEQVGPKATFGLAFDPCVVKIVKLLMLSLQHASPRATKKAWSLAPTIGRSQTQ